MSWLSPSTEIVSGWLSSAYAGHGVLGSDIPSTGDNGGSPVLNDGVSPTSEYRWVAESLPASGTLTLFEDLTFEHIGAADGFYSFDYRLYEDGVDQGTATVTLQFGSSQTVITATTANVAGSIASHSVVSCTIAATTDSAVGSLLSSVSPLSNFAATTTDVVGTIASSVSPLSNIAATTGDALGSLVSGVGIFCTINATTSDATGSLLSYSSATSQISATTGQVVGSVLSSSSGICTTAIHAITDQLVGAFNSTGYTQPGVALSDADIARIVAAVLAALQATTTPVNVVAVNGDPVAVWPTTNDNAAAVVAAINTSPDTLTVPKFIGLS